VNPLQESFLAHASPEWLGLVGDPNQSIYGWRGSSPDLIRGKITDPSFGRYPLSRNFRCAVEHLALANSLASDGVRLVSGTGRHGKLWMRSYRSREEELDAVAAAAHRCAPDGDLTILARSRAPLQQIEERLLSLGVKNYRLRGALSVRDRTETKDVVAYFRVALNPNDFVAARRVFHLYPGVGPKTAAQMAEAIRHGAGFRSPASCDRIPWLLSRLADESSPMAVRAKLLREEYEKLLETKWRSDPEQFKRRKKILGDIVASASASKSARAWIDVAALDRDAVAGHGGEDSKPKQTIELATIHAYKGAEKEAYLGDRRQRGTVPPPQPTGRGGEAAGLRRGDPLAVRSGHHVFPGGEAIPVFSHGWARSGGEIGRSPPPRARGVVARVPIGA
ncbi:MAG: 3'-5' exonuclease, partial [Methylacidiphilaceae bacterium]|nr:3'-5' exonuclease [Candidatus Methylacidiphilaceae bacterium]